jgi:hypothetical protein
VRKKPPSFFGGANVSVGGELGGLGSNNFTTWIVKGRASATVLTGYFDARISL